MSIRDATIDDLDEIIAMVHELAEYEHEPDAVVLVPEEFARHLFGPDAVARCLILEQGASDATDADAADAVPATAGMALYYRTFSTWLGQDGIWLEDLFVRQEFRRHGYGRMLLDALRQRTAGRVEWAVLDWNTSAQAFYRSIGAAPVDGWTIWRWPPVTSRP